MKCCLGLETSVNDYIGHMVYIMRLAKDVLRDDGTLWLNIGDSYAANQKSRNDEQVCRKSKLNGGKTSQIACKDQIKKTVRKIKAKDMMGVPWMLAFALREDGWFLRQDIIWHKLNCMPESCNDRCTKNHEYVFLLSKSKKYYFDQLAIATPIAASTANDSRLINDDYTTLTPEHGYPGHATRGNGMLKPKYKIPNAWDTGPGNHLVLEWATEENQGRHKQMREPRPGIDILGGNQGNGDIPPVAKSQTFRRDYHKSAEPIFGQKSVQHRADRQDPVLTGLANKRSVWSLPTEGFKEAHFATFPQRLIEDPIKAATSAYGCCAACGAAYRRLTVKELIPGPKAALTFVVDKRDIEADSRDAGSNRAKDGHKSGWHNKTTTTGWIKTCKCQTDEIKPAIVLDMFMGSGTTAIVASKLGRNFIGFEQSAKYLKIAERRMHLELGIFNPVH